MKFYLSSFKLGEKSEELVRLMGKNKKIAYVPNASDYTVINWEQKNEWEKIDIEDLEKIGLVVEYLDLKKYFGKVEELRKKLNEFGGVFIKGGNTFILRQAMKLSGFDIIFNEFLKKENFVYAGYSAAICVLSNSLNGVHIVDDPTDMPYKEIQETIWEGLGFLDYMVFPHYKSDHPESAGVDKEIEFAKKNNIKFKTLRDGEVIIIE